MNTCRHNFRPKIVTLDLSIRFFFFFFSIFFFFFVGGPPKSFWGGVTPQMPDHLPFYRYPSIFILAVILLPAQLIMSFLAETLRSLQPLQHSSNEQAPNAACDINRITVHHL